MDKEMKPIIESYNEDEEWLYNKPYLFIKGYATGRNFSNTLKALPLARKIHDGQYRNGTVIVNGKEVQLPYIIHVLKVCSTLMSLNLPLSEYELDILYATAICHDMIEDRPDLFTNGGEELTTKYFLDENIYNAVKLLSKQSKLDEYQLNDYFNNLKHNKFALLVKLADRSHNVETLSVMKIERLHKYVDETRRWIYPLCSYGKQNYPELSNGFTILKAKIVSLTEETEVLVEMFSEKLREKEREIVELRQRLETEKNYNYERMFDELQQIQEEKGIDNNDA